MWIHNEPNWPNFTWNEASLSSLLADIRYQEGRLIGRMESLGFHLRQEACLETLTKDIIKSSAIEGETLPLDEVRSSIARHLGIDVGGVAPSTRAVDGIVEMMLDATQHYAEALTAERLQNWHAALFPTGRSGMRWIAVGGWRSPESGPMQVVSGPIGREKVHFVAPDATRLDEEMAMFLTWFNDCTDVHPILKAGIAHFWFVTIHPFEDGNGRIARAIGDMALAQADKTAYRFYSLSTQIEAERKQYYQQLEAQQRGNLDMTSWLHWFLSCLSRALSSAETTLAHILYKAALWEEARRHGVNERQALVITRMLEIQFEGFMNTSKYAKIAKCSPDTALRDIQDLKNKGILIQNPGGGRSTSYRLNQV